MLTVLGTLLIVLASIVVGLAADRRWDLIPRRERLRAAGGLPLLTGAVAGSVPETAIEARAGEIELLRRKRCPCRGEVDILADETVTHEGRELLVLHSRCIRCGQLRDIHVRALQ